jgi:hypothetical protein
MQNLEERNSRSKNLASSQSTLCQRMSWCKRATDSQCATQANFHGVNSVLDLKLTTALDNLSMAATTDCNIVKQLIQSNKQLVEMNAILTAQLKHDMGGDQHSNDQETRNQQAQEPT